MSSNYPVDEVTGEKGILPLEFEFVATLIENLGVVHNSTSRNLPSRNTCTYVHGYM